MDEPKPRRIQVMHRYTYRSLVTGKKVRTRHLLTAEDAATQLPPDAQIIPGTREDREVGGEDVNAGGVLRDDVPKFNPQTGRMEPPKGQG